MSTSMAAYDTDPDCHKVGGMLAPDIRIYLCGRVTIERNERVLTEAAIGGRQGRLLFAFLGTRRTQPVSKPDLIGAITASRAMWARISSPCRRRGSTLKMHARQSIVPRARFGATRCPPRGLRPMSP